VDHPFDQAALTEALARSNALRLGLEISQQAELDYLLATDSIDVQAAPGSGKTSLTGLKLCLLASVWNAPRQGICVLSHTNTAKDQIRAILESDSDGRRVLGYPHFVGTIQTFVDTFLALPYLRSAGIDVRSVDNDVYAVAAIRAWNNRRDCMTLRGSLGSRTNGEELIATACFRYEKGAFRVAPESLNWPFGPTATSTQLYEKLKKAMQAEGRFRYSDMYSFAMAQLDQVPAIVEAICRRFPFLVIDEMQDTSILQQQMLASVFPANKAVVQRIGDENQRIYGAGLQAPDETFPVAPHIDLGHSRRFGPNIATVASRLTVKTPQDITPANGQLVDHLLFILFDRNSAIQVMPAFEQRVQELVDSEILAKYPVKAIGARRQGSTAQSCVGGICDYGLTASVPSTVRSTQSLSEVVNWAKTTAATSANTFGSWQAFFAFLHELAVANGFEIDGRRPTVRRLHRLLEDHAGRPLVRMRKIVRDLVLSSELSESAWNESVENLTTTLLDATGMKSLNTEARERLAYRDRITPAGADVLSAGSGMGHGVYVDTIHNVKGETHAATLVLQCRDSTGKMNDLAEVASLLAGEMDQKRQKLKTMERVCQLAFVAATRPIACLAFAVAKEDLTASAVTTLAAEGWEVIDLTGIDQQLTPL
jgi:hypothetical protein